MQVVAAAPGAKPRPDRERLRVLYVDEKKSLAQIGAIYGVSRALVAKWLNKDGTPVRSVSEGTTLACQGRVFSEEHKQKLRENIAKGRAHLTADSHRKRGDALRGKTPWNKGNPMSEEQRAKLTELRADPDYRRAMSERFRGERSANWKGGVKPEHALRLDRAEWARIRREVYERDGWTCQDCLCRCLNSADAKAYPKRKIQAHHLVARRDGGSDELSNLVTLCMSCHHVRERSSHRPT